MIPVVNSAWWDNVLATSHAVSFRFELKSWDGTFIQNLYPASGSIDVDVSGGVTRSIHLKMYDDGTLIPTTNNTKLSPLSDNEIWAYYIVSDAGVTDEVLVGIFRVGQLSISYDDESIQLSVDGYDRGVVLTSFAYPATTSIAAGTPLVSGATNTVLSAIATIIRDYRNITIDTDVPTGLPTYALPTTFGKYLGAGNYASPWEDLYAVAQSVGCVLHFSNNGTLTLESVPILDATTAVTTFSSATNVIAASRDYDFSNFCNALKLNGVSTSLTTPLTYTYAPEPSDSPFATSAVGTRLMTADNEWVFSSSQAQLAAAGMYQLVRGYDVELSVLPNPRLDIMDPVRVTVPALSLDSVGIVTRITLPLDSTSPMRVTVRVRGY